MLSNSSRSQIPSSGRQECWDGRPLNSGSLAHTTCSSRSQNLFSFDGESSYVDWNYTAFCGFVYRQNWTQALVTGNCSHSDISGSPMTIHRVKSVAAHVS